MERLAIDLLAPEFYVGDPYPTYAWMRANEPVYWDATNELWGISRYDDVVEIEKRQGHLHQLRHREGRLPAEPPGRPRDHRPRRPAPREAPQPRLPPLHPAGRLGLGGRHPGQRSPACSTRVQAKGGTAEIVDELAAPLPAMMIGKLLGFDEDDWPKLQALVGDAPSPSAAAPATSTRSA